MKKVIHAVIIGVATTAIFSTLLALGFFASWQSAASDKIFQPRGASKNIVIVAIDNNSIAKIGRWPWSRTNITDVLSQIAKGKPAAIGVDVAFLDSESDSVDNQLAETIGSLGNVVIAAEAENKGILLPIPALQEKASFGIANITPDPDGVARFAPLSATGPDGKIYKHFTIQVLDKYYKALGKTGIKTENIPQENGALRINYAGAPGSFTSYSFYDVLTGSVPPADFRDKIVLIGATAPDLHDNLITPVSSGIPMDGVEIHANIIQTMMDGKYLVSEPEIATIATIAIVAILLSTLLMFLPFYAAIFATFLVLGIYVIYAIFSFDAGIIRNLIVSPLAIIVTGTADIIYRYFSEFRQKKYIKKAFSYYLSTPVLSEILSHPENLKLGGTRQEISVLFSDIAGFTSISEKLNAEDLAHILNGYLNKMTGIVFANQGVLDKYIGDAVMAFWGAPLKESDHAYLACKTALEMFAEMDDIRTEWKKYGIEEFDIRIGINTGEMVVGNMGSDVRFDYTLLGDNVNLGSRLEGINKEYGTKIIISESTYKKVKERVAVRKLDKVAVKGKKTGVTIYELRGLGTPTDSEFLVDFEKARMLYEKGKFANALTAFKKLEREHSTDKPIKVYIERLNNLTKERPKDWDGIFKATSK